MRKKIGLKLEGREKIELLVNTVKDRETIYKNYGQFIEKIKEILDMPDKKLNISDDDYWYRVNIARVIAVFTMGVAVEVMIPEEDYDDIVLEILPFRQENTTKGKVTLGTQYKKDDRSVNSINIATIEDLASGNIYNFCISLGTFAHELWHTKQMFDSSKKDVLTIPNLICCLERIAHYDDYDDNYDYIFYELEATYYETIFSSEVLRFLLKEDLDTEKYIDIMMEKKSNNWRNILFDFNTQCNLVEILLKKIENKNIPITEDTIRKYPILSLIFKDQNNLLSNKLNSDKINEQEKELYRLLLKVAQDMKKNSSSYGIR